jgi:hypothetical protein
VIRVYSVDSWSNIFLIFDITVSVLPGIRYFLSMVMDVLAMPYAASPDVKVVNSDEVLS